MKHSPTSHSKSEKLRWFWHAQMTIVLAVGLLAQRAERRRQPEAWALASLVEVYARAASVQIMQSAAQIAESDPDDPSLPFLWQMAAGMLMGALAARAIMARCTGRGHALVYALRYARLPAPSMSAPVKSAAVAPVYRAYPLGYLDSS